LKPEVSISKIVRKLVDAHPSLFDGLKNRLINFTAAAKLLKPEIEKFLGIEVSLESIKMALIRYSEEVSKEKHVFENNIKKVVSNTTLQLRNEVVVLTIRWEAFITNFDKIIPLIKSSRFFQVTQGIDTFTIVMEKKQSDNVVKIVGKESIIESIVDQSAIILQSPKEIITTPGVIAYITDLLYRNGINLTQIISCYIDTLFIVDSKNALNAYRIIEDNIKLMRNI
jgi:hypothetical protein